MAGRRTLCDSSTGRVVFLRFSGAHSNNHPAIRQHPNHLQVIIDKLYQYAIIVSLNRHDSSVPCETMRPRHAVLLTPLECTVPICILFSKQSAPVNPLKCALTTRSQLIENTATLSLAECAVTRLSPATPLECAVAKKVGGGGYSHHFVTNLSFAMSEAEGPLLPRHNAQVLSFQILAHSFALFCTLAKLNPFPFKQLRTLCRKPASSRYLLPALHYAVHVRVAIGYRRESRVTSPTVPNRTDAYALLHIYNCCAVLPSLHSGDRPFVPPWRSS